MVRQVGRGDQRLDPAVDQADALARTPVISGLYRGLRQVFETLFSTSGTSFRTVGLGPGQVEEEAGGRVRGAGQEHPDMLVSGSEGALHPQSRLQAMAAGLRVAQVGPIQPRPSANSPASPAAMHSITSDRGR
jgi:hypothetical protein